jgi:2-C-methyl-D-erythritol 4-phosphate cytidylyltransferase
LKITRPGDMELARFYLEEERASQHAAGRNK